MPANRATRGKREEPTVPSAAEPETSDPADQIPKSGDGVDDEGRGPVPADGVVDIVDGEDVPSGGDEGDS